MPTRNSNGIDRILVMEEVNPTKACETFHCSVSSSLQDNGMDNTDSIENCVGCVRCCRMQSYFIYYGGVVQ